MSMVFLVVISLVVVMMSSVAQASVVALRATTGASIGDVITLRDSASVNNGAGSTSLSVAMPVGVIMSGDVMVAAVTVRGGTGITFTPPSGWTSLQRQNSTTVLAQELYWKQAGAGEVGPYVWSWTGTQKGSVVMLTYANAASSTPIDVSSGQANASSATITAPGVTTTVANDMLVGFFGVANSGVSTATNMTAIRMTDASTGGLANTRTGTIGADLLLGAAGATGNKTTSGGTAGVNIGQLVAIKPNAATSLSLGMPTGTVQNDVMVAAITVTGGTGITLTPPAGWTSIQRQNSTTVIGQQLYWKLAGASEAGPYSWSWTGAQRASGVILSYSGVDTTTPIDVSSGQANASSTTITAPSVTTTGSAMQYDALVGFFGIANATIVDPAAPMTRRDEGFALGTSNLTDTLGADQKLTSNGATGTRTATAATAAVNIGQLVAIKPIDARLTQSSHRWFDQPASTAGTNWNVQTSAANNSWNAVTYGNGLFVAVACGVSATSCNATAGNRVMTSPDGITWTSQISAANNAWNSVTYGNGLFVAVAATGTGNRVMTSPDGITWTSQTSAADLSWNSVTYGNGLFVAVSSDGTNNRVMTSANGTTWTSQTSAANNAWNSVTYGNGLFVAVACGVSSTSCNATAGNHVMTSSNGTSWTTQTSTVTNQWASVTYGNGLFVATSITGTGNRVMTSPDGVTWTVQTSIADNDWYSITYGNGLFVASATSGTNNRVMTSPDGITWTSRTTTADNWWWAVTYGNGIFVSVGGNGTNTRVMTSDSQMDATAATWTSRTPIANRALSSITYGNGLFVAVAENKDVMTSPDGITWTSHPASAVRWWSAVTYGNGLFVAVAQNTVTSNIMTSPDGVTWTTQVAPSTNDWASVTYGNGLFVAVSITTGGTTGRVMTSPDGVTWTSSNSAAAIQWNSVTYGNGLYVAVGQGCTGNCVMTSPDGTNWTSRNAAVDLNWTGVTYGNGLYVAVSTSATGGMQNHVMTSPDGVTWTTHDASVSNPWYAITYGNGLFVAVSIGGGTGNRVMTSPDGITWTTRTSAADIDWTYVIYSNGLFVAVGQNGTGNGVMTAPGIDATVGGALAAQDTALVDTTGDKVRLRMNVGVSNSTFSATEQQLGLQYAPSNGPCTGSETYQEVGTGPWTARTSAADHQWRAVAYGNGKFVAVATSGFVMTSPDGTTWTTQTPSVSNNWTSVTYGKGLFVAVGSTGGTTSAMTSPDGVTWTTSTSIAHAWSSVVYGNGVFVAVGYDLGSVNNHVMSSTNGTSWTSRTAATDNGWNGVTYGNGTFVAVSDSGTGNRAMTSPDGTTWTTRSTTGADMSWGHITYGNGTFVAVAYSGGTNTRVMTSPDGVAWTLRSTPADVAWEDITYGAGLFMAVADSGTSNRVMTSPDGVVWTLHAPADNLWSGVAYGNGTFVGVGYTAGTGNQVITMSPPVNWGGSLDNNYGGLVADGNDPTQGGTILPQNYVSNNNFTSMFDTPTSQYGSWDFDLDISRAPYDGSYCFRMAYANGTALYSYGTYPQISHCNSQPLDRRLRHGTSFCGGSKGHFWSAASS